jgi:hypothetical protein
MNPTISTVEAERSESRVRRRGLLAVAVASLLAEVRDPLGANARRQNRRKKRKLRRCRAEANAARPDIEAFCGGQPPADVERCLSDLGACLALQARCMPEQAAACVNDSGWPL